MTYPIKYTDQKGRTKTDTRYTVRPEYTGHQSGKPQQVARFCGEWIGSDETVKGAELLCIIHDDERNLKLLGA